MRKPKERVLSPVRPSAGLNIDYRKKLDALIDAMTRSYARWLLAQYRRTPPKLAQDAMPARELERELKGLGKRWNKQFDEAAPRLARWFATRTERRSTRRLEQILRDGGLSVQFKMTPAMSDVAAATVAENVSLIKSIAQQYHTEVQGLVMRSVTAGRDLEQLSKELEARFGITKRRAALIARDQNQKATAVFTRVRQEEAGIEEAVWLHSHGGKEPRPTHLANDGKRYKVSEGWFDPDPRVRRHIHPGELINCFPASTVIEFAHDVEKAFRHPYCGELTEIVTDSGKTLRATPNHPVLTTLGWRAIDALNVGDDVIEVADQTIDSAMMKRDVDRTVATISQIFRSITQPRSLEVALGDEFHGDVVANSNIDIVLSAGPLSFGRQSLDVESFKKFGLSVPDKAAFPRRPLYQFTVASLHAANRVMGGSRELLPLLWSSICHSYEHGLALIPNRSAYALNPNLDRFSLMPELFGKRENTPTAFVQIAKPVRIIGVERCAFSGHVFNLQTRGGYYSAEGIIVHNCRCVSRPIIRGFS